MNSHPQTRLQLVIERRYQRSLRDVIDWLLYDENLTHEQAAERLKINQATLWRWRRQLAREAQATPDTRLEAAS